MSLLASIAGAVAGPLISGLFGSRKKDTTTTTQKTEFDFEQLRESAEAAGFNPLTALGAAGAPTSTTSTSTGTGLSTIDFIAQGVGNGIQAYAAYDPVQKEREALEIQLMRADLDRINRAPAGYQQHMAVPQRTSRPGNVSYPSPALAVPATAGGFSEPPRDSRVVVPGMDQNDLAVGGETFSVNNNSSSAEDVETQYGEAGGILYGVGRLAGDMWANYRRPINEFKEMRDGFRDPWAERDAARANPQPSIRLLPPNPMDRIREDEFYRRSQPTYQ